MQQQFKDALFTHSETLLNDIKAEDLGERNQRLNVYRNNVYVSLQEALADIFPVCKQLVGEEFFNAMARQFIERHPPTSPILSEYGDVFSTFVAHFFPAQSLPYLSLLCDLEYRLLQLTHQAEIDTLSLEAAQQRLSQVQDPEQLQLHITPQCVLLKAPFAIASLYLAHQQPEPDLSHIDLSQTEYILLVKSDLYGRCYVLSEEEFDFIRTLKSHASLTQALPKSDTFDLGQTLAKLMNWKIFTDISEA